MKNLLKLELRKIRKQKSFYICTLVMVGLLFLSVLTSDALSKNSELAGQFSSSGFDIIVSSLNSSSFLLVAGIFVALCVCNDYEQETIKNIYARGYSRKRVYFSKLISVWISTTIMFTVVMLCAFIFGRAYFGTANLEGSRLIYYRRPVHGLYGKHILIFLCQLADTEKRSVHRCHHRCSNDCQYAARNA